MSVNFETKLDIPDLWFDFYARFLPGVTFVGAARVTVLENFEVPNAAEIIVIAFLGFVCALVTQPLSSLITKCLERKVSRWKAPGKDCLYVRKVQEKLIGLERNRQSMIISKMHGETTFFIQMFVLNLVLLFLEIGKGYFKDLLKIHSILLVIFLLCALEVAARRVKRANDLEKCLKVE